MEKFKQTWWDENLDKQFGSFEIWVGDKTAPSKAYFRNYVKERGYTSLIDMGCGNATEYFAYREEYPDLSYIGVDSSEFLYKKNTEAGVPMMWAVAEHVPMIDGYAEVVFARHILEHQPDFEPVLSEILRLASKEAIVVFFIPPLEEKQIIYNPDMNLYHNVYSKGEIEKYLMSRRDVADFSWIPITSTEIALSVIKKPLD